MTHIYRIERFGLKPCIHNRTCLESKAKLALRARNSFFGELKTSDFPASGAGMSQKGSLGGTNIQ